MTSRAELDPHEDEIVRLDEGFYYRGNYPPQNHNHDRSPYIHKLGAQ